MKRFKSNTSGHSKTADHEGSRIPEAKCGLNPIKMMGIFVVFLMGFSVLFSLSTVLKDPLSDGLWTVAEARLLDVKPLPKEGTFLVFNLMSVRLEFSYSPVATFCTNFCEQALILVEPRFYTERFTVVRER